MSFIRQIRAFHLVFLLVLLAAGYFRAAGLYRGLEDGTVAHPDARKQILMLDHYLHGNAVAYHGNLFYDGYPYGLNRVDEWAIRAARSVGDAIRGILVPGDEMHMVPSRHHSLFHWARSLRVIYGLIAMLLVFGAVLRFGRDRWAALAAAALYGLAPLGSTVTHAATGDVGVDLFIAAALYAAAAFAGNGRIRWLAALSAACGMAFACKYQGALGLWIGGLPLLLAFSGTDRPWRRLLRRGWTMAAGFAAGVLALTPGFCVDPEKTWRNMWLNFSFVKDYGVSADFLEQPLLARMRWGLGHNVPFVAESIGYGLLAMGLLALVASLGTARRVFRTEFADRETRERERRRAATFVAVASFPWMALFLATALKPEVQPFHFSFLLPPLAVACGMGWISIGPHGNRAGRISAVVLLAICLVELTAGSLREDFFWRRPEIHQAGAEYSQTVFGTDEYGTRRHVGRRVIKQFYVEPAVLPVFRSRPCGLKHPEVEWWRQQIQLPVPSIPFPGGGHWIFMNGPVFPRNDRMFAVPASGTGMFGRPGYGGDDLLLTTLRDQGAWIEHTLVFNRQPENVQLGLRTGRWPARYVLEASGEKPSAGFLPPHSQILLPLRNLRPRFAFPGSDGKPEAQIVTLRMRAQLGPVWATVLASDKARALYLRHGPPSGAAPEAAFQPDWNDDVLLEQLRSLRYVDSTGPLEVTEKPRALPGGENPLEAGAYVLTARVLNPGPARRLRLELLDASGLAHSVPALEVDVPPGEVEVVWRFTKDFAPYDGDLCASADGPGLSIPSWTLVPDVDALQRWQPAAAATSPPDMPPETVLDVRYPGIGTWHGIQMPDAIPADQMFPYAVRFDLDEAVPHRIFHEFHLFLHLRNAQGEQVATLDYPLSQASFVSDRINWKTGGPFPAGPYTLEGGLYNVRTGIRARFVAPDGASSDSKRRTFSIRKLMVGEPAATAERTD